RVLFRSLHCARSPQRIPRSRHRCNSQAERHSQADREGFRALVQYAQAASDNSLVAPLFKESAVKVVADQLNGNFSKHVLRLTRCRIIAPKLWSSGDVRRHSEPLRLQNVVSRELGAHAVAVLARHAATSLFSRGMIVKNGAERPLRNLERSARTRIVIERLRRRCQNLSVLLAQ